MAERGEIITVGTVDDMPDGSVSVTGWLIKSATGYGVDLSNNTLCGWTLEELRLIAQRETTDVPA
jgi:hypothetical protein